MGVMVRAEESDGGAADYQVDGADAEAVDAHVGETERTQTDIDGTGIVEAERCDGSSCRTTCLAASPRVCVCAAGCRRGRRIAAGSLVAITLRADSRSQGKDV